METFSIDVLIIGAGGAGLRAAIEAKEQGASVLLVGKEVLGCAHTGMAMGGLNASMVSPATPKFHAQITNEGGYFINNRKIVKVFTDEMPARVLDLERYGVMFDRKDDGSFYVWAGSKQKYPLNICVGDYTGREMMQGLVDQSRKIGVMYKDECFISKLLTKGKRVIGAVGLDLKTGEIFSVSAASIILATGGAGRMYEVTTNAASNTGDGYALALDAGCALIDMEMVQFHPTGIAYPPSVRGVLVTEKVRAHGGILRNKNGERFMSRYFPKEMELAKRDEVSRSIYQEVKEGRGTVHDGVYLHVDHWKKEEIFDKIPDVYEQHKNIGIDISKEPMEIYPSMHHMMGGIRMNEWGKTTVKGLFVCGEVAGGVHGANRLGGNSIAEGQVFGRRSAISAVQYAKKHSRALIVTSDVTVEAERISAYRAGKHGVSPHIIESKLKKLMWEYVGIYRNEKDLLKAKKEILSLAKALKHMKARSDASTRNRDLQDCLEVSNMLKTAYAVVLCAFKRKESRGAHSRSDYPKTKKSWEKNIVIYQEKQKLILSYAGVVKSA
ncbi:FAD-binding protein [Candidatus Gottesmanbacteria bacterium]|nr:FAD-binding protein [Candidatus Gottesmanbacteria bacterium]